MGQELHSEDRRTPQERMRDVLGGKRRMVPEQAMNALHEVLGTKPQKTETFGPGNIPVPSDDVEEGEIITNESISEQQEEPQASEETHEESREVVSMLGTDDEPETEEEEKGPGLFEKARGAIAEGVGTAKDKLQSALNLRKGSNEMTAPDEQEQALNTLPADQERQLNGFSQELASKFADGVSSMVDQDVIAMLQRLPQSGQDKWWKLLLSPGEGWKALGAEAKEVGARAKLRNSITETAMTIANLGEEEMEREVFQTFLSTLKRNYGETGIQIFCDEHDIEVPGEGTQAEKILLLRLHSADLALPRYRAAIRDQMMRFTKTRANYEGDIAMSRMKAQMLPSLIEARKEENPLRQKEIFQKAGHAGAIVIGTPVAFVAGATGGGLSALFYGFEHGWNGGKNLIVKGAKGAAEGVKSGASKISEGFNNWKNS